MGNTLVLEVADAGKDEYFIPSPLLRERARVRVFLKTSSPRFA
jgi:hypothetical protein